MTVKVTHHTFVDSEDDTVHFYNFPERKEVLVSWAYNAVRSRLMSYDELTTELSEPTIYDDYSFFSLHCDLDDEVRPILYVEGGKISMFVDFVRDDLGIAATDAPAATVDSRLSVLEKRMDELTTLMYDD